MSLGEARGEDEGVLCLEEEEAREWEDGELGRPRAEDAREHAEADVGRRRDERGGREGSRNTPAVLCSFVCRANTSSKSPSLQSNKQD